MEAYLDANDMREAVEQIYEVPPLPDNSTLAQIRNQKEMKQRKSKVFEGAFLVDQPYPKRRAGLLVSEQTGDV